MSDSSKKMAEIVERLETPTTTYVEDNNGYEPTDYKKGMVDRVEVDTPATDTHRTLNYGDFGGDTWVVRGKLVDGTKATVADDATVAELISALKDTGVIKPNDFDIDAVAVPTPSSMPTPETASNSAKISAFDVTDNVITLTLSCKVEDLEDADHGETWGTHKWLGFGVETGLASILGVEFSDSVMIATGADPYVMTSADVDEATTLGLDAGSFVLYIKAEDMGYKTGAKYIVLGKIAYADTPITIKIVENPVEIELVEDSVEIGG